MDAPPPQFANYPRPSGPGGPGYPSPFWRPPGVYIEVISDAWRLVTQDLAIWICTSLVLFVLQLILNFGTNLAVYGSITMVARSPVFNWGSYWTALGLQLTGGMLLAVIQPGMMLMAVRKARGEQIQIGDMFAGYRRFFPVLGTLFLQGLAIVIGFVFCIVPGIFLAGAFALAPLIALDQGVDPIEAMTRSYKTVGSDAWLMFCVLLLAGLIAAVGVCACGIGYLITLPMYIASVGLSYHYLFPPAAPTGPGYGYTPDVG